MPRWHVPAEMLLWISHMSQPLHARLAWRLPHLLTGMGDGRWPVGCGPPNSLTISELLTS
jgi:hypothetical protein